MPKLTPADEAEQLRATIREAHEVLRDLRVEIKEARALARGEIREQIRTEVARAVDQLGKVTRTAMGEAVDKVGREFGRLEALFLGTDRQSAREGKPPLEQLVRAAAERSSE